MKEQHKRLLIKSLIISLNILAMVGIVCLLSFWYMPKYLNDVTGHGVQVQVPSVVNLPAEEAISLLEENGLAPMVIDTIFSDAHAPGAVVDQLPEGNLPVKLGRNVYLTINSRVTQQFMFPKIENSPGQVRSDLEYRYFVVDSLRYEPYEIDRYVMRVENSATGEEMVEGQLYPKRTHVVIVVGSTEKEVEAANDEHENTFFE